MRRRHHDVSCAVCTRCAWLECISFFFVVCSVCSSAFRWKVLSRQIQGNNKCFAKGGGQTLHGSKRTCSPGLLFEHLLLWWNSPSGTSRSVPEIPVHVSWSRPTTRVARSTSRILCPTQPGIARRSEPSTSWHFQPRPHRWRWLRAVDRVLEVPPKSRCVRR